MDLGLYWNQRSTQHDKVQKERQARHRAPWKRAAEIAAVAWNGSWPGSGGPMFVRPCWAPHSVDAAYDLIDAYPWALIVSNGEDGPLATNLPLLLDRSRGPHGFLVGHIARANPHCRVVEQSSLPTLAIFHGPVGYVTPSWYPGRDMPGTYYYTAVHCYGHVRIQSGDALEASLQVLNDRMERTIPDGWSMSEIPHSEITRRLPAIMGFELEIERIQGKFKLGQDEPKRDALSVATHLAAAPGDVHATLAEAVHRANRDRDESGS